MRTWKYHRDGGQMSDSLYLKMILYLIQSFRSKEIPNSLSPEVQDGTPDGLFNVLFLYRIGCDKTKKGNQKEKLILSNR